MCVDMPTDIRQACLTYRWETLFETGSNGYRLVYTAVLDVPKPHEHPGEKKVLFLSRHAGTWQVSGLGCDGMMADLGFINTRDLL